MDKGAMHDTQAQFPGKSKSNIVSHTITKRKLASDTEYECEEAELRKLQSKIHALTDKVVLAIETARDSIVQRVTCKFLIEENTSNNLWFVGVDHLVVWDKVPIEKVAFMHYL